MILLLRLIDVTVSATLQLATYTTFVGYLYGWNSFETAMLVAVVYIADVIPCYRQFPMIHSSRGLQWPE